MSIIFVHVLDTSTSSNRLALTMTLYLFRFQSTEAFISEQLAKEYSSIAIEDSKKLRQIKKERAACSPSSDESHPHEPGNAHGADAWPLRQAASEVSIRSNYSEV